MKLLNEENFMLNNNREFDKIDISKYRFQLKEQIENDKDIIMLSNQINFKNPNDILEFGSDAYKGISSVSGEFIRYLKVDNDDSIRAALKKLTEIMNCFDMDDFTLENEGIFKKLFKKEKPIEFLTKKYGSLANDIESFYRNLKYEEKKIESSNKSLELMLLENMRYYELLEKYLFIASSIRSRLQQSLNEKSYTSKMEEAENLLLIEMLDKRIEDFKIGEIISIESIIMIDKIKKANIALLEKIQSSFIIALPIFRNNLSQIVILKREELKNKSIAAIKKKTEGINNLSSFKYIEKNKNELEKSFNNIIDGIKESSKIEESKELVKKEKKRNLEKIIENSNFINKNP